MKLEIRLDYATFNWEAGKMDEFEVARRLIGSSDIGFQRKGLNENAPLYSPLGLRWMGNNGYSEMPHKLEVSGVGCEHFALTLPSLRPNSRFSRLDFAFDVLMDRQQWRDYITHCFAASMNSERQMRKFVLQGSGEAMTIYIGSRKCSKYFRIYNKTLEDPKYKYVVDGQEVQLDVDQCVIRYEVELHRFKDSHQTYDPSQLFDWYYDPDKKSELSEYIRSLWLRYGNDVLLPADFENVEFYPRIETNAYFVQLRVRMRLSVMLCVYCPCLLLLWFRCGLAAAG